MVVAYDYGAVWVAKDNLRTHIYEFVHEEESAFEHFLVNQYAAFALGCNHEHNREQVRGEPWPGGVGYGQNGPVKKGFDFITVLGRNEDVVAALLEFDA